MEGRAVQGNASPGRGEAGLMEPDAPGELLHHVRLDREHCVDTWRSPSGSIVILLMDGKGRAVQLAVVPRVLRWSKWARRWYRHRVVRRWILAPD